ncbi:organic solute transporter subunit alpha [Aplysia californica]|uniref:Organic solute transporter subunit alpha n=1 Tax=Aplysia californica TaxID=6500 RepID=A0ABM0JDW9_APLCA|nr:organic solute transporter subunit alpha [Aplysia californica]XP_035829620.1 organic solute transporter subunit alpha [Aplysia californica]
MAGQGSIPEGNCSDTLPLSEDFFRDISNVELGFVIVCGVLTAVTLALYVEKIYFVLTHYHTKASVIHRAIQILGTSPVVSLSAMLAIIIPRASLVSDLVGTVYIAWALHNFTLLMVDFAGGEERVLEQLSGQFIQLQSPPCCCCCPCLPKVDITRSSLRNLRLLVLQTALVQPVLAFLSVILWLDEKYMKGVIKADNAYPYLAFPNAVSTLLAMYGLLLMFRSSHQILLPLQPRAKMVVLQLCLIVQNLQGFVFVTLQKNDIPVCKGILSSKVRGRALMHMLVVVEMFALTLMARFFYRRPHSMDTAVVQVDGSNAPSIEVSPVASPNQCRRQEKYGVNSCADPSTPQPSLSTSQRENLAFEDDRD